MTGGVAEAVKGTNFKYLADSLSPCAFACFNNFSANFPLLSAVSNCAEASLKMSDTSFLLSDFLSLNNSFVAVNFSIILVVCFNVFSNF